MVLKTENFNVDPNWDSHNNRPATAEAPPSPQSVTQNFRWISNTSNAGGTAGEIGGLITPTGEPAYYAKAISNLTLNDSFSASGKLKMDGGGNTLLGFFNSNVVNQNEWRTPNSMVIRLYGRGSYMLANPEYGTSKWRAGAGATGSFSVASPLNWSFNYSPAGNGSATLTIGTQSLTMTLDAGHKADGATFNRFGLLNIMKSYDSPGNLWVDDLVVNGVSHNFTTNPNFDAAGNQTSFSTENVRFRFNFGYSNTNNAGGAGAGEAGGDFFRGDSRQSRTMAFYGASLDQTLNLNQPLHAHGKVTFKRGVSDSTVHFGFFHNTDSVRVSAAQAISTPEDFLGATIEGPSSDGFFFYPSYNTDQEGTGSGGNRGIVTPPYIYPDDTTHNWTLDYNPAGNGGLGQIIVTLDGVQGIMNLSASAKGVGAHFNRFGFITPQIDGNGQTVFIDDITYTTAATALPPQWYVDSSGNWNVTTNWLDGAPNAVGATASFLGAITSPSTIYTDTPVTAGTMRFDNANMYVIGGLGTLTMQVATGSALIDVVQGTHKINLPLTIASDTTINVANAATLLISDPVTVNAGKRLAQSVGGSVRYESTISAGAGGTITFNSSSHALSLTLGSGARAELSAANPSAYLLQVHSLTAPSDARVDLGDNALAINYTGSSPLASVRSQVAAAYAANWNANGITSSSAASSIGSDHPLGIGVAEASALGSSTTYMGEQIDSTTVLARATYYGDADLNGTVDSQDFSRLVAGYGVTTGGVWTSGDFDYNGKVNSQDFNMLAGNFGQAMASPVLGAIVPEPMSISLLFAGSLNLLPRTRRGR
jgi:hypothetical protein